VNRWYRVFGRGETQPSPERVLQQLRELGVEGHAQFRGDEDGWTSLEIAVAGVDALTLSCYLASEKGIRADLNSWAAEVEAREDFPHRVSLMERIIQTRQWYTLESPSGHEVVAESVSRFLARETDGVYQVDGEGYFDPEKGLLLAEE
jgi:hypothetical protein